MPSRMIRGDDLLGSERYMKLTDELKVFYVHVLCSADDFGLLSLAPLSARNLFSKPPSQDRVMRLARALEGVDLVRIYSFNEVFYLFVPRFSQRLKKFTSRCPMPPRSTFQDDEHAVENFSKYKGQFKKLATASGGQATASRESRPEVEVKGREEKRSGSEGAHATGNGTEPPAPDHAKVNGEEIDPNGNVKTLEQRAEALGLTQGPTEARSMFMARVASEEWKRRSASETGAAT